MSSSSGVLGAATELNADLVKRFVELVAAVLAEDTAKDEDKNEDEDMVEQPPLKRARSTKRGTKGGAAKKRARGQAYMARRFGWQA